MSNLKMYCITVQDSHLDLIQNLNYIPVGLGNNINSKLHFVTKIMNFFIASTTKKKISNVADSKIIFS